MDAVAAMALVPEKHPGFERRDIVGAVEGLAADPKDWWIVVAARTHEEEWEVYGAWPEAEQGPGSGDEVARGMVVRELGNALSAGDALLTLFGHAAGVLQ